MADPKVTACLTFEGANGAQAFSDTLGNDWTGEGAAALSTTAPLFDPSSGLVPNTASYFRSLDVAPFRLGAGDFAVEAWLSTDVGDVTVIDADGDNGGFVIGLTSGASANPTVFFYSNGGDYLETSMAPFGLSFMGAGLFYVLFQRIGGTLGVWCNLKHLFYANQASSVDYSHVPASVAMGRRIATPSSRPFVGKFGGLRVTRDGYRFPFGDLSAIPSPHDVLGGGATIVEAEGALSGSATVAGAGGLVLGAVGAASGTMTVAAESSVVMGVTGDLAGEVSLDALAASVIAAAGDIAGEAPLVAVGGSIRGAVWEVTGAIEAIFQSNAVAGAEGDLIASMEVDALFVGAAIGGAEASIDTYAEVDAIGGALATADATIDGEADLDGQFTGIYSAVANAVLQVIFDAAGAGVILPGSGGSTTPAALLRVMARPERPRLMERPSNPRSMTP